MRWMKSFALFTALCGWSGVSMANEGDRFAIESLMKQTWESVDAQLDVSPITIEEGYAIAGWLQNDRGGRALLRNVHGTWRVVLCAGDGLLDSTLLRNAGLTATQADALLRETRRAEAALPVEQVRKFALFQGTVKVGSHQQHKGTTH